VVLKTKTFSGGGVHVPHYKKMTEHRSIETLPLPKKLVLPLQMHCGKPAIPMVQAGDEVTVGQIIARADGIMSAYIHAPVSGTVAKIDTTDTATARMVPCIVLETAEEGKTDCSASSALPWETMEPAEIIAALSEAGIVGKGGAMFPTHVKLNPPPDKPIDTLIINGVECEPYLTCDHRTMLEQTEEMITGITIAARILNCTNIYIGIEDNKQDAIEKIAALVQDDALITVVPLKVKYPQGAEKQLIQAITGREVPSGGLPMNIGVVVINVGTAVSIYDAVIRQRPFIDRIVTVSGSCIKKPGNYSIRIGMTISELVEQLGGFTAPPAAVIMGGPMMGVAVPHLDIPIVKGSSGILFLSKKELPSLPSSKWASCIHCARCVFTCPSGLNPSEMSILAESQQWTAMKTDANLLDCIACGACSTVCPCNRPLVQWFNQAKIMVRQEWV